MTLLGILLAALLGAACVTVVPNPFTSPDVERARLLCLGSGGVWLEQAEAYTCRMSPGASPDKTL